MDIHSYLKEAVDQRASDILIIAGLPLSFKIAGAIRPQSPEKLGPDSSREAVQQLYALANRDVQRYVETGDDDFSLSIPGLSRFRVNAYRQRSSMAAVIRVVSFDLPDHEELGIPGEVMAVAKKSRGLVLVTGPSGGGKSTTLACIVEAINQSRNCHIITLEDPIEYLYRNKEAAVSQREIATDTGNYLTALRACMRQTPDVILLGEMRDFETIRTAMTAAETGHLLLSTLHTTGAVSTIDRIIDVFPPDQQQQIRVQLSMVLQTVISQQLLPTVDGREVPAFEIMHLNSAVRNLIREAKIHQIDAVIQSSAAEGMISMDQSIAALYNAGRITEETALKYAVNPEQLRRRLRV